jgi:transcriptional regulator with XRE-family HTH domain
MKALRDGPDAGANSGADSGAVGAAVWVAVGRRRPRRRPELGFSTHHVAEWGGVSVEAYQGYERGAPIPASLLGQIAELFDIPVVWFFEGVADEEAANLDEGPATDLDGGPSAEPVVYRVATVEHRIQALADTFRKLDFEGQQHLLAISKALTRASHSVTRD